MKVLRIEVSVQGGCYTCPLCFLVTSPDQTALEEGASITNARLLPSSHCFSACQSVLETMLHMLPA